MRRVIMPLKTNFFLLLIVTPVLVVLPLVCVSAHTADEPKLAKSYAAVIEALDPWIQAEVKAKRLPALSIALVDDQTRIWSKGYGHSNPKTNTLASADTVYRVGSV